VEHPPEHETRTGATAAPGTAGRSGPSIGELFSRLSEQLSRLVRDEIQLAKTEMAAKGKELGVGIAIFAVAGLLAFFGAATLVAAAVLGLAEAVPAWLSAIIVGILLLAVAGVAALLGKKRLEKGAPPTPDAAQRNVKRDIEAVKKGIQS
jgi:hypothetical protein